MAHNLDTTNGRTSFVSAREDAWHRLGTVLPDSFTANEAMEHGLLGGWNVRKVPVMAEIAEGLTIPVPEKFAVVRNNPVVAGQVDPLGVVGPAYHVVQNEELAGLLDNLVDESGAKFETAGAIDGGRKVFITMKLPGSIKIGGVDPVENYIAAMTGHDGRTATTLLVTPVRIVCQNTMNLAFNNHSHIFRVRHTVGAQKILLQQAREAMEFTYDYLDGFQAEAERLINTELTLGRFEEIVTKAFGAPEGAPAATVTRNENKIDEIVGLFADSFTHEGVRETAWAGLNALTEWNDHFAPIRGTEGSSEVEADLRARRALLDSDFKNAARKMILAAV